MSAAMVAARAVVIAVSARTVVIAVLARTVAVAVPAPGIAVMRTAALRSGGQSTRQHGTDWDGRRQRLSGGRREM
jgi:hypothetical protein